MNYSTLDRFQGAWLGSMFGAILSKSLNESDRNKIIQYELANWTKTRDIIAQIIINKQLTESTIAQLNEILTEYCTNDFLGEINNSLKISKINLINCKGNAICMLLPLIMLQEDSQKIIELYTNIIVKYTFGFDSDTENKQEIVIWNYLIIMALNNQLPLEESNVSMMIQQSLGDAEIQATSLVKQLNTVGHAQEQGWSLQQLADKLNQQILENNSTTIFGSAIALSLYCFISTPRNFMLSVKRANAVDSELSAIVTVLTASISGAYNGMSGMPRNLQLATKDSQSCQQAKKTVTRLYEIWLGVYNSDNLKLLHNPEINAVASPQIFQYRQNLKIISQKPSLS